MTMHTEGHWEHFHHVADIGVRGEGVSLAEAFAQAALALTAVITDPALVDSRRAVTIRCEAPDRELLLVDWLNALVYEMSTRGMLFARFEVSIDDNGLSATAWGEPIDPRRHRPAVEVKGATYTELRVGQGADGHWFAQCVVDV
jgi:tRNA nucleotidyltransferase (CCA-adding enzyme)